MAWTKRQIIDRAFSALGINYTFDKEPHEYITALQTLDSMMAAYSVTKPLPYPTSNTADSTALDESSNLPDWALQGVWANLAMMLCPDLGKEVPAVLLKMAQDGDKAISTALASCPPQACGDTRLLNMGAGNNPVPNWFYTVRGF